MAKIVRRAAKKAIISAKDNHSLLSLLIFDEKIVCQNLTKLVNSSESASLSLLKWSRQEENLALGDVFSKGVEVGSMWAAVLKQYGEKHMQYRSVLKEILQEERVLDDMRKKELHYSSKLNKLQRQVEQNKRKSDVAKSKSLMEEMAEILSLSDEARAELEVKVTKHEISKATKLRNALYSKSEVIANVAKQALLVSEAYNALADLIPDTPTQLSQTRVYPGAGQTRRVVTELAKELKLEPVLLADGGNDNHTYLYAVSNLKPNKQSTESPPTSPLGFSENKHPKMQSTTSVDLPPRKISNESQLLNQRFGRTLSMDNLRPPPSCPPPPLPTEHRGYPSNQHNTTALKAIQNQNFGKPQSLEDLVSSSRIKKGPFAAQNPNNDKWYARSKAVEAESDSEGTDGYTEPYTDPALAQCNSTDVKTGYKSLLRSTESDRNVGISKTSSDDSHGQTQCGSASQRSRYHSLNNDKSHGDDGAVHYDGCYLQLLHK